MVKISAAKQVHYESGPNMTPLVDVVMVILIFLMLAGNFGTSERYMVTTLPVMDGGGQKSPRKRDVNDEPPPSAKVYATVTKTGGVSLNNGPAITDLKKALPDAFKTLLAQNTANGRPKKEVQLLISPHRDTEWDMIAPVYGAALKAEFTNIGFQAAN
ncbi:MAG TPA: biopolymer transporter ExbD [Humisphaera sp.]